jgi:hypothetical protein
MLNKISSFFEKRRLQKSFAKLFVRAYGRDTFRYYENGRSVNVNAELMTGSTGIDRVIYHQCPLKWNDTGQALTTEEREKVFQKVVAYFDEAGIKWKFSDASPASYDGNQWHDKTSPT